MNFLPLWWKLLCKFFVLLQYGFNNNEEFGYFLAFLERRFRVFTLQAFKCKQSFVMLVFPMYAPVSWAFNYILFIQQLI